VLCLRPPPGPAPGRCQPSRSHGSLADTAHLLAAHRQKLRKAEDAETRKKLVQERSATMPKDDAGRKRLALQSREGYLKMYKAYCAQPAPANPAVCSNESLKKVYDNMAKSIAPSSPTP